MPTQSEIANHLDMSERNARDVLNGLAEKNNQSKDWWKKASIDEVRIAYIRDLRDKAAGRGGSQQESLATAKTEEAQVKTALNRLTYQEKLGTLVLADDVGYALNDWAGYANREYKSGIEKIIQSVESAHGISVDREMVNNVAGSTTERIQGYAGKLCTAVVERDGDIQPAEAGGDSGVVE